ncbi:MAG TPA: sensor histidine kinase [Candidatus Limnocylindrales bacterium]|nr:sensor histidine kinase [Candidatus Limnocylindrales bacterium]
MPTDPAHGQANERFDRIGAEATESLRGDSRRVHELAEQFREQYRRDLEEWMQLRARLDRRGGALRPVGTDALRSEYEARGRELAALQARLKRLDVVARQLDILWSYLDSTDEAGDEPGPMADDSPATMSLRIVQAQEGERQRMAEDIHDGPAQVLTNAIFQVEYLDRILGDTDRPAHAEIAFLRDMLRNGLDEVRTFITDLRPPMADVGVAVALAERAAQLEERHGIVVEVSVDGIDDRLTPTQRSSVLRIVQEALQNVRKHAAASKVAIGLEGDALVIEDNGRGFDLMRLASGKSRNFGLQFMRERAELFGGQLQIESRQGEGTRILLRLPGRAS